MSVDRVFQPFRRLQWKLTLSYTAVTVGSLLVVVFILGYFLLSRLLIPLDILNNVLSPKYWIQTVSENSTPLWRQVLSEEPINTSLISAMLQEGDLQISQFDLIRIGDLQIQLKTVAQGSALLVDPNGILIGASNPKLVPESAIGHPINASILPGLEGPLNTALHGQVDPDRLFVTLELNERFYFAIPFFDETNQEVLGVAIVYIESLPTESDLPGNMFSLLGRSVLILLLAAGIVGTIFGGMTANGMVVRLERVSKVTDAWSHGDFSKFIEDSAGDEISQLAVRLNHMAEQLANFIKRSQEMAVSEERNRLARDLHDSAKQEALAASFHLGTALTLFERDPQSAKSHLVEADNLVDSVRGELTDLIHELRPPSMNGASFDETVNEYIIEWAHQTGIKVIFNVEGYFDLPLETKQAIYRVLQEALANAARHSSADNVEVALDYGENTVQLTIIDDGLGFDTKEHHDGMGLDSMRERAESLDGHFIILSTPGEGTRVVITLPNK
jgi:signal transduction histidine kinase